MRKNERPIEYAFALKCIRDTAPESVLDVGSGSTVLPFLVAQCGIYIRAVDKEKNTRFFPVEALDITRSTLHRKFDFITCISVMEHIEEYDAAIANMVKMLNPGGYLCLTFPFNEELFIDNVYDVPGAGYGQNADFICRVYDYETIHMWEKQLSIALLEEELWECFTGQFWTFGKRLLPPKLSDYGEPHHLICLLYKVSENA